jgi:S-(hydroxymethyl)glutathione dehydrogenase/alcohol dehydrogenase
MAKRFGATHGIDASQTDPVKAIQEMTGSRGVDYSFEAVGNTKVARHCFESVRRGGTATIIGMLPVGQGVEIEASQLLPERKLQGSMLGSMWFRISIPRFVDYYLQGQLNLDDMIIRRGKLEDVNEAFRAMRAGEVARSVLMLG